MQNKVVTEFILYVICVPRIDFDKPFVMYNFIISVIFLFLYYLPQSSLIYDHDTRNFHG